MQSWIFRSALVALLLTLLQGCVSSGGPKKVKVDKQKALETHIQLGVSYIRNKNLDLARHHFNKAYAIDPNAPGAHNGRALLYQLEGEPKLAEEHFKKALKSDANYTVARNNYGGYLYQQKRFQEAYNEFDRVSRDLDYPRRSVALLSLGRTALKLKRVDRAQAALAQALVLQPRLGAAMAELAQIHFDKGEYAESQQYLSDFSEISRQSARTLWLGIQIERIFKNPDKEASYAMALKNMHPYSKELLEYQRSLKTDQ